MQVNHTTLKAVEGDVTTILGHGRTHPRIQQFLDLAHNIHIRPRMLGMARCRLFALNNRGARLVMLHNRAQNGRFDMIPRAGFCLGHGDEIIAKKHARHPAGGKDPRWLENVRGCNEHQIPVGAYHFAVPDRRCGDALAEARYCVARMAGLQLELPPVLDLEDNGAKLAPAELEAWALAWLAEVERLTGRKPILYSGTHFLTKHAGAGKQLAASGVRYWVARYRGGKHTDPSPLGAFNASRIWQHS